MEGSLKILKDPNDILRATVNSKINCTIVGIYSDKLGMGTYLTAVKEILYPANEEPVIVLSEFDVTGYFLEMNTLRLSDIGSIIPFVTKFENPYLKKFNKAESLSKN